MQSSDLAIAIEGAGVLARREDAYVSDILLNLFTYRMKHQPYQSEVVLQFLIESMFLSNLPIDTLKYRIELNRVGIVFLMENLQTISNRTLRVTLLKLMSKEPDLSKTTILMIEGHSLVNSNSQRMEITLSQETDAFLNAVASIRAPELAEYCLQIAQKTTIPEIAQKGFRIARMLLNGFSASPRFTN